MEVKKTHGKIRRCLKFQIRAQFSQKQNDAQGVDRLGTEIPGPGVMLNHQAFAIARTDRTTMEPDLSTPSIDASRSGVGKERGGP